MTVTRRYDPFAEELGGLRYEADNSVTNITAPLISGTGALLTPTVSASVDITAPLISGSAALDTPTVTVSVSITAPLISGTATTETPTVTASGDITAPLISGTGTTYAPTVLGDAGDTNITAPLISGSVELFQALAADAIAIATTLVSGVTVLYDPAVTISGPTWIDAPLINSATVLYEPSLTLSFSRIAPTVTATVTLYQPNVGGDATAVPIPTYVTVFDLPQTDLLGCGVYEVYFKTRGGDYFVCRALNMTNLTWGRKLNGVSEASITFAMSGSQGNCCGCIAQINPWQHEMSVYRNGEEVWCGPVTGGEVDEAAGTARFDAKDLSAWFGKRWVEAVDTDVEFEEADIVDVYNWLISHAYYKDPWNMEWFFSQPRLGIPIDRTYVSFDPPNDRWGGNYPTVEAEMSDLSQSGVDYTTVRRVLVAGDLQSSTDVVARLSDNHWNSPPKIIIGGVGMATEVGVGGGAGGSEGWYDDQIWIHRPNDAAREQYGLLQYFEAAPDLDEEDTRSVPNAIAQRAYGLRELKKLPYEYIQGGGLSAQAPVTFDELVPGRYFRVDLAQTCRSIIGNYMLTSVNVSYSNDNESVNIELTPPGVETLMGDQFRTQQPTYAGGSLGTVPHAIVGVGVNPGVSGTPRVQSSTGGPGGTPVDPNRPPASGGGGGGGGGSGGGGGNQPTNPEPYVPDPNAPPPVPGEGGKPAIPPDGQGYLGSSLYTKNGESKAQSLIRTEGLFQRELAITHYFLTGTEWPSSEFATDVAAGRYPHISFKVGSWASVRAGQNDAYIATIAGRVRDLGGPCFVTYWHEPTNDAGAAADYVGAWRRVHDIFQAEGATNGAFTWVMIAYDLRVGFPADSWYPGTEYVDWLGIDPYNWAPNRPGSNWTDLSKICQHALAYTKKINKPMLIAETGTNENNVASPNKAQWFDNARVWFESEPYVKGLVYFNNIHQNSAGFWNDWQVDTSPAALAAWRRLSTSARWAFRGA